MLDSLEHALKRCFGQGESSNVDVIEFYFFFASIVGSQLKKHQLNRWRNGITCLEMILIYDIGIMNLGMEMCLLL